MDLNLSSAVRLAPAESSGGMPPESRLDMPSQDLGFSRRHLEPASSSAAVIFARIILATISVGVTVYGVYQMLQVVRFTSMTWLQGLMIFFFAISLAWIAFAAGSVLAGASKRRDPMPAPDEGTGSTLTALVMPIYNEDPTRTTAALQSMAEGLGRIGTQGAFEIVVLSEIGRASCRERVCKQV